jgi:hypothetical protein
MPTEQKIIKNKVGLLELARQFGNVSQACKIARAIDAYVGQSRSGKTGQWHK